MYIMSYLFMNIHKKMIIINKFIFYNYNMYSFEFDENSKDYLYYYLGKEFDNQPQEYKNKNINFTTSIISDKNQYNLNDDGGFYKLINYKFPLNNFEWYFEKSIIQIEIIEEGNAKMCNSFSDYNLYYYKRVIIRNSSLDILDKFMNIIKNYKDATKPDNNYIKIYYNFKNSWELYNTISPQSIDNIYLDNKF